MTISGMRIQNCIELLPLLEKDVRIFLGPRPGRKSINRLAELKLTHCCTLLSEREDVQPIRKISEKLGIQWIWLPIEGGRMDILQRVDMPGHLAQLAREIKEEPNPRIYFHCSAGIHRTGFFAYTLLRLRGLDRQQALEALEHIRTVTAQQVGAERLDLADNMLDA